jgi:hypothetical protein
LNYNERRRRKNSLKKEHPIESEYYHKKSDIIALISFLFIIKTTV